MLVVARGNDDSARARIVKRIRWIGGCIFKTKFSFDMVRAESGRIDDRAKINLTLQMWQEHGASEVARADDIEMTNRCWNPSRFGDFDFLCLDFGFR